MARTKTILFECDNTECDAEAPFDNVDAARDGGWICGRHGDFCSKDCRDENAQERAWECAPSPEVK